MFVSRQEIPIVAKDATFLISLATEEFVKRLCQASQRVAEREKRATVQQRDIGTSRFTSRDVGAKFTV
jgi:DNA polymerase epsilon subunit 4